MDSRKIPFFLQSKIRCFYCIVFCFVLFFCLNFKFKFLSELDLFLNRVKDISKMFEDTLPQNESRNKVSMGDFIIWCTAFG